MAKSKQFKSETYLIELTESCPESCVQYLVNCLEGSKLSLEIENVADHRFIAVSCNFAQLCVKVGRQFLLFF